MIERKFACDFYSACAQGTALYVKWSAESNKYIRLEANFVQAIETKKLFNTLFEKEMERNLEYHE